METKPDHEIDSIEFSSIVRRDLTSKSLPRHATCQLEKSLNCEVLLVGMTSMLKKKRILLAQ